MQAKKPNQDVPVRYVRGVGPAKSRNFEKLGIMTVSDLFYYLPRRYEDRSRVISIKDAQLGQMQTVVGKVEKTSIFNAFTGTNIVEMIAGDGHKKIHSVWYNQPYMKKVFSPGQKVMLYGKVELQKHLQITHPAFEIIDDGKEQNSLNIGRIVPFYSLTEKVTQRYLRKSVDNAIHSYLNGVNDNLPTHIRARRKLVDIKFALENIHFPISFDTLEKAYRRVVFEEFFILQMIMAVRRKKVRGKGIKYDVQDVLLGNFQNLFNFEFTKDQEKCIKGIEKDMTSEKPMYRLLQGDVGSGKTVVAMYAALLAVKNGYQTAVMVPTEILARQHFVTISKVFMPLGINVRLLVSGMNPELKRIVNDEIKNGEADIVVGTHSLIQEKISFNKLGLAVIDEQHKFGVNQRKKLQSKGNMPDVLVMTATPIPRSLVLTVYGDMDVSVLKEKPGSRGTVTTYWVGENKRESVYEFLKDEISEGHQAFIVCPRIKNAVGKDLKSVEEMYVNLCENVFPKNKIALIHGRLKSEEKEKIMDAFRDKKYDILLATTVVEVGVDIPNVTVMLLENAEYYGLAQLHQLRGRIGRGKHQSYCILVGDPKTESSFERLSTLTETDDGFVIAEKDLDIRGPGEFLGTRQSGLPELRFGNIAKDFSIMEDAREEAFKIVNEDPFLKDSRNEGIKSLILERFKGKIMI